MAFSDQTNETSVVGTNTVGQEVPFTFPIAATSDLRVVSKVTATAVPTTLTITTNYTVTISGDTGGTVTMVTAVATTAEIWVIRDTPNTQTLDLETGDAFNAENVEDALDKNTKLIIENANKKVLSAPETDDGLTLEIPNAVSRADKFLTFDSSGNVTATSSETVGAVAFGTYGETFAGLATVGAAQTSLGMSAFMITLLDDATATAHLATLDLVITAFAKTMLDDAAATNVLTTLGFSTYAKTLIDDTTAAATRVTLGALNPSDIICGEGGVLTYNNRVLTKYNYA